MIIGAGASGLMAARHLTTLGIPVRVLEARDRIGGRICTVSEGFSFPVEHGAEFVHGDLPLTRSLLRSAGIPMVPAGGRMVRSSSGRWVSSDMFDWERVLGAMLSLSSDMPLVDFLDRHFASDAATYNAVRGFAEGYDLADIRFVSTLALAREWSREEGAQHRIRGGYGALIGFLAASVPSIHTGIPVGSISWSQGQVSAGGFSGDAVLVTVPLGVLQAGAIDFSPALPAYLAASRALGYGTVTKILLEFERPFWKDAVPGAGFILSDQPVPTWWTQAPFDTPLLTGWWRGSHPGVDVVGLSLQSLSGIFGALPPLRASRVDDWQLDPFSLGAYSYPRVGESPHRALLNTPVSDTVFFAGEGLYDGDDTPGTVEAALCSGLAAAEKIAAVFAGKARG
ncbi:flavin monoamine oxidase family protein [Dinghuibacter silviterrae]|uniref:flavin monoamine oxidase family protein n=1 Tax=Dinghuibacter silviterrae TaxID=1539049 RepID=UPI0013C354C5|nr:NAD(P)/FAD-dependent oxidoreductase [Dinghuibacter silviterrae]